MYGLTDFPEALVEVNLEVVVAIEELNRRITEVVHSTDRPIRALENSALGVIIWHRNFAWMLISNIFQLNAHTNTQC